MRPHQHLSPQQLNLLQVLGTHYSAAATAAELGISLPALADQLAEIRTRLGVASTTAALAAVTHPGPGQDLPDQDDDPPAGK